MFLAEWLDGRRIRVFADKLVLIRLSLMKSNAEKFFFYRGKIFFQVEKIGTRYFVFVRYASLQC